MKIASASVQLLCTSDGLVALEDHVSVGDIFLLDTDRIKYIVWHHIESGADVNRASIWVQSSKTGTAGWMPLELFNLHQGQS